MKVYNQIGSNKRFLEMFQGINKIKLNENIIDSAKNSKNLVEAAFEELLYDKININQTNNQIEGEETILEIIGNDDANNIVAFKFRVTSNPTDQDDVTRVDNATLIKFNMKSSSFNVEIPEADNAVRELNGKYGKEMIEIAIEYGDFQSTEDSVTDEIFEEAIKLIDKVPYLKGTEQMQTNKAYADQKPTNPDVRVKSNELQQYVSEIQDYEDDYTQDVSTEDPLAIPPEFTGAEITKILKDPNADDETIRGIDPWEKEMADYNNEPVEKVSPEKTRIINQAYENIINTGNQSPTHDEIMREINRLEGNIKPVEKTRAIPKGAEEFWEGAGDSIVRDIDSDVIAGNNFNTLTPEKKEEYIRNAAQGLERVVGNFKHFMPQEKWVNAVKELAIIIHQKHVAKLNETDYPTQMGIGKEFKIVTKYPKPKKKYVQKTKIKTGVSENEDEPVTDTGGGNLSIGDIVNINNIEGNYQIGISHSEGKPFLMPFDIKIKKPNTEYKIYITSLKDPSFTKVMSFSDTQGGFMSETEDIQDKEVGNQIDGGLADEKDPIDFNPQQIMIGMGVEMEHTDDPKIALEITMDHLIEIPDYYTRLNKMEAEAKAENSDSVDEMKDGEKDEELTDELLGYKSHNVGDDYNKEDTNKHPLADILDSDGTEEDLSKQNTGAKGVNQALEGQNIAEEEDFDEYQGDIGDRYQDGEGNQFTVRNKVTGGVTLQGQGGEKEIATRDIQFLKKISEEKVVEKEIITEEQVKLARQVLNNRELNEGMSKKEAVQVLIKHNIK